MSNPILALPSFGAVGGCMLFLAGALEILIPTAIAALALFAVAIYNDWVRLQRIALSGGGQSR